MVNEDNLADGQLDFLYNPMPGIPISVTDLNDTIKVIDTSPPISPDLFTATAEIMQDIEDIEGYYDVNLGRAPARKETASGLLMRHSSAQKRQGVRVTLFKEAMLEIGKLSLKILSTLQTKAIPITYRNEGERQYASNVMPEKAVDLYQMSLILDADAEGFKELDRQLIIQFLQMLQANPHMQTRVDWEMLFKYIAEKHFRISEAEEMLTPPNPFLQMLHNMPEELVAQIVSKGIEVIKGENQGGSPGPAGQGMQQIAALPSPRGQTPDKHPGVGGEQDLLSGIFGRVYGELGG